MMLSRSSSPVLRATISSCARTVIELNTLVFWNERAIPCSRRHATGRLVMSSPSSTTLPPDSRAGPDSASMKDDLPAPLGPMTPCSMPGSTAMSTLSTAVTAP